jgi:hypothetical protein
MKKIFALLILTGFIVCDASLVFLGTGCDEIQAPCDIEETAKGMPSLDAKYLDPQLPWRKEGSYGILRFVFYDKAILFVCTDKTVAYQATLEKAFLTTVFPVLPEARLIWKYSAPKPSKAVLMGAGSFRRLFELSKSVTIYETPIWLAYSEEALGGVFVPGVEIRIPTAGNLSDDYKFVFWNFNLNFDYKVTYRMTY